MSINSDRLWQTIQSLGAIGRNVNGRGVTRLAFSPQDMEARDYLMKLMSSYGFTVRIDAVGNIIGRIEGEKGKPAIVMGSHIDTVPEGGIFDGALGVLAGVECVKCIQESGYANRHPLEVIAFSDEEGCRFGRGTLGSRAITGALSEQDLLTYVDVTGDTAAKVLKTNGFWPGLVAEAHRENEEIAVFLELHIEQGPILSKLGVQVGIVKSIVGIRRYHIHLEGEANHAGTTPMEYRKDALVTASSIVTDVMGLVRSYEELVGTVGRLEVSPGAPNIVPGIVDMTVELRSPKKETLDEASFKVEELIKKKAKDDGLNYLVKETVYNVPVKMNQQLMNLIAEQCEKLGIKNRIMHSGAGHDAMLMGKVWPTGMIFVPSVRGLSHNPHEFTSQEDVTAGAKVLLETILEYDERTV